MPYLAQGLVVTGCYAVRSLHGSQRGQLCVAQHARRGLLLPDDDGRLLEGLLQVELSLLLLNLIHTLTTGHLSEALNMGRRTSWASQVGNLGDLRYGGWDLVGAGKLPWIALMGLLRSSRLFCAILASLLDLLDDVEPAAVSLARLFGSQA